MLDVLKRAVPERLRPSEIWFQSVLRDFERHGVLHGPFKGMRFIQDHRPIILNCLLGIYERELHPVIRQIEVDIRPRTVIDIGAFFGYYAIGLARLLPEARVIAYESSPAKQPNLNANIVTNNVALRVAVRGEGTLQTLSADVGAATPPVLLVCDIDGPEIDLINPAECPGLDACALLIETHGNDITTALQRRLSATHRVQHIPSRPLTMDDVPVRPWYLALSEPIQFLTERPPDNCWLWALPQR